MSKDMDYCLSDICEMKKTVTSWLKMELAKGPDCANIQQFKELCDGVKDLAEAEKYIMESEYFCNVNKAMEEASTVMPDMYGYNPARYPTSGRFAPAGKGVIRPGYDVHNRMPFDKAYIEDPDQFKNTMRMYGYHDGMDYDPWHRPSKNGEVYDKYTEAKRYYHSGDTTKKGDMKTLANDWMAGMLGTATEMWTDADPDQQASMLKSMEALVNTMRETKK